jgi:cell wall-associated NlpC family hydrolase
MVDVSRLIGAPFVTGGRGPDSFDCYGLVMHLLREHHGIAIPDFKSSADQTVIMAKFAAGVQAWREVPPMAGAVALFRIGRHISHCGYLLDSTQMVHTWEQSGGVVIERLDPWRRRIAGFYQYVGEPT